MFDLAMGGVKSYRFFLLSDCLGRRLGPSFLGRVDDSEVCGLLPLICFSFQYLK